jgi:hypothetical protein
LVSCGFNSTLKHLILNFKDYLLTHKTMAKRNIYFASIFTVFAVISATLINSTYTTIPSYDANRVAPINKQGRDVNGINAAFDYYNSIRNDVFTNELPVEIVRSINDQVRTMSVSNKTSLLKWESLGPNNVGGRTRAILIDKDNPNLIFAGSVSGGLWRSTTGGTSWVPVNDKQENLAVSAISQSPNGDIIYSTGEAQYQGNGTGSQGVIGRGLYKSTDRGITFTHMPSTHKTATGTLKEAFEWTSAIEIDPTDGNNIYVATRKGNLRISRDAGLTWITNATVKSTGVCHDVAVASNGNVLATTSIGVFQSSDNGNTFTAVTGIFGGRKDVTFASSDPNIAYVVTESGNSLGSVYRSEDSGLSFEKIGSGTGSFNPLGFQGNYNIALGASAGDPNKIVLGGQVQTWSWKNGWVQIGNTFRFPGNNNYIHADQHTVEVDVSNPDRLFIGCDGGVFLSKDFNSSTVTFTEQVKNYVTTQFYAIATTKDGAVLAGAQDNGTYLVEGKEQGQFGKSIFGGDGFYCAASAIQPNTFFMTSQFGVLGRSNNRGVGGQLFYDNNFTTTPIGNSQTYNCAPFVSNFRLWEDLTDSISLLASGHSDCAGKPEVWVTTGALDFSSTPRWIQVATGGSGTVSGIEISNNGDHIFFSAGSRVYRISGVREGISEGLIGSQGDTSSNVVLDTSLIKTTLVYSAGQTVTGIAIDENDEDRVIITLGNYNNANHIYLSENATSNTPNFTNIQNNLPAMPAYDAIIDNRNGDRLFVGTELGIYMSENKGVTWSIVDDGMPNVPVFMLVQQKMIPGAVNQSYIYAATHGRGMFMTKGVTFPTSIDEDLNGVNALALYASIYPNPVSTNAILNIASSENINAEVAIYSLKGELVRTMKGLNLKEGNQEVKVNVESLKAGSYFARVIAGKETAVSKFIITK